MRLQITTGFATGVAVETLKVLGATTTEQLDGNDSATFRIRQSRSGRLFPRAPLRFFGSDGLVREYRVRRLFGDPRGNWVDIECSPPLFDLGTAGLVRTIVNGTMITADGGSEPLAAWVALLLENLSQDGLDWVDSTPGAIESSQIITKQYAQITRLELGRQLSAETGLELAFLPTGTGGKYQIHMLRERASTSPIIRLGSGTALMTIGVDSSDEGLATAVQPIGDVPTGSTEPASIAQNLWRVSSVLSGGWVTLIDPAGGDPPIAFDDMLAGNYVQFAVGGTIYARAIADSRAVDSAIQLADTTGLAAGTFVTLVDDAVGTPLYELINPLSSSYYGRVLKPLPIPGMRGEANRVANPNFSLGATPWTAPGSGWLETYGRDENVDLTAAANGASSIGATSIPVDGLAAGTVIRRGERLKIGATVLGTTNADRVVPSTLAVTVPLAGTLAASLLDGQAVDEYVGSTPTGRAFTANGAQSAGASSIDLLSPIGTRKLLNGDKLAFQAGGDYTAVSDGGTYSYTYPSDSVHSFVFTLASPLAAASGAAQTPTQPTMAISAAIRLYSESSNEINAALGAAYNPGDGTITVNIVGVTGQTITFSGETLFFATVQSFVNRTLTNADTEFDNAKQAGASWAGSVSASDLWRILWYSSTDVFVGVLAKTGTISGTSHTVQNDGGVVRIPSGTSFRTQGQSLYTTATATANGSGQVTLSTTAAISAISDNAEVVVIRNTYGWYDVGGGNTYLLRSTTGWISSESLIFVTPGTSKTIWAIFWGTLWSSLPPGPSNGSATMNVVNAEDGAVLATLPITFDDLEVAPDGQRCLPITGALKLQLELTFTTLLRIEVTITSSTMNLAQEGHAMGVWAMIAETTDPEIPFTGSSHCNVGWQKGMRYLTLYNRDLRNIDVTAAQLADIPGASLLAHRFEVGVRCFVPEANEAVRVVNWTRDHFFPQKSRISLESLRKSIARLLGAGSASSFTG